MKKQNLFKKKKKNANKIWMDLNCPFKPYIPESVRNLVQKDENYPQFIKRLLTSKKEAEELLVEIRKNEKNEGCQKVSKKNNGLLNKSKSRIGIKELNKNTNLDSFYDSKLLENKNKIQSEEIINNLEKKRNTGLRIQ